MVFRKERRQWRRSAAEEGGGGRSLAEGDGAVREREREQFGSGNNIYIHG